MSLGKMGHIGGDLDSYLAADKVAGFEAGKPLLRCALVEEHGSGTTSFVLTTHHTLPLARPLAKLEKCSDFPPLRFGDWIRCGDKSSIITSK